MQEVIIVGAGASGLMAAHVLGKAGARVVVLEARDRIGGRIFPLHEGAFGSTAQGGAEFVHGKAPLTRALAHEAGLDFLAAGQWWSVRDGEPTQSEPASPYQQRVIEKLLALESDMTVADFLIQEFPGEQYASLRDSITRRLQGYDAADPARASAFALRDEMSDEGAWQQSRLKEGYGGLLHFLESACRERGTSVQLGAVVSSIAIEGEQVVVRSSAGNEWRADRAIVTVPPPLLGSIAYSPEQPDKIAATGAIGFGAVVKILLAFDERWWTGVRGAQFEKLFFMFSHEAIPTWWTQYPDLSPTLTGWLAGVRAEEYAALPEDMILDQALASLSNIFQISREELAQRLRAHKIVNWPADPFARGGYSYRTPESEAAIRTILSPIADRVFFAGEALCDREYGTVEAALESGKTAAEAILEIGFAK